jgi:hypothetical protein
MTKPKINDWIRAKRIPRYLKGTKMKKITYRKEKNSNQIMGYSDASYGEDRIDRKSTSAYVFIKGNGPISWKSKKQPIISLSSMESEYIALAAAVKEALWLKKLEEELENETNQIQIYEDNQSTIKTSKDTIHNDRSKHIDVRYHFIREVINNKIINLEYKSTEEMIADALTKPVGPVKLMKLCNQMGLSDKTRLK